MNFVGSSRVWHKATPVILEPYLDLGRGEVNLTRQSFSFRCGQVSLLAEPALQSERLRLCEEHTTFTLLSLSVMALFLIAFVSVVAFLLFDFLTETARQKSQVHVAAQTEDSTVTLGLLQRAPVCRRCRSSHWLLRSVRLRRLGHLMKRCGQYKSSPVQAFPGSSSVRQSCSPERRMETPGARTCTRR